MRKLHPEGPLWTFWDYKFERWQKDKGMRLDHFLLSPNLSGRLVDGGVDRWARGQESLATRKREIGNSQRLGLPTALNHTAGPFVSNRTRLNVGLAFNWENFPVRWNPSGPITLGSNPAIL